MLDISNNIPSATSIVSYACYAGAAVLVGRKIGLATGCKAISLITGLFNKETANHWNQSASDYFESAKKSAFRDLTSTAGLLATAITMNCVGTCPLKEEEEEGFFDHVYKARYEYLAYQLGLMVAVSPIYAAIIRQEIKDFKIPIPYPG